MSIFSNLLQSTAKSNSTIPKPNTLIDTTAVLTVYLDILMTTVTVREEN